MSRIDLLVPFEDKDEAKRLGARWDSASQLWFVPDSVDVAAFSRWLPPAEAVNVRSPSYYIAASSRDCWQCQKTTAVHGFILPAGHETLYVGEEPENDVWERAEDPTVLSYIDYLAPRLVARMQAQTAHYRIGYSGVTRTFYWMNRCERCGAKLGDHETFSEPGEGFLAFTLEDARRIRLTHVPEPFSASCGSYTMGVVLFERMRRA